MIDNDIYSERHSVPAELPILPLRGIVVFPSMVLPITVGREKSFKLIDDASTGNRIIGVVAQRDSQNNDPSSEDLYKVGTAVTILKTFRLPDNTVQLLIHGFSRIIVQEYTQEKPYFKAKVKAVEVSEDDERLSEVQALTRNILDILEKISGLSVHMGSELYSMALNIKSPSRIADMVISALNLTLEQEQEFIETLDIETRLQKLNVLLNKELQLSELSSKIQTDVKEKIDKTQREFILREQLKAIKKELGEEEEANEEIKILRDRVIKARMPPEVQKEADREIERMSKIPTVSPEYTVSRTYLEWLVSLPWAVGTQDNLDIDTAKKVLDEDHYDLEKIKERILEFLAVRTLKKETKGPILCFVGPPGVGKTSLGKSIARAMGRRFIRISLGGIRDEADIRGHRRTYIGAMPGRIVQGLRRAGSNNPVFMMDEVDKIGFDFRGDPASALLEVLDSEQNNAFVDHYLDVAFDLSKVMFITTANVAHTIPAPLLDRMEVLQLSGYTEEEKLKIAQRYLVPRQIDANGIPAYKVTFKDEAIMRIIRDYTREAGLRNLEREIGTVCRKLATDYARGKQDPVIITADNAPDLLGPMRFFAEVAERINKPGVAIGLAWTQTGGDIIFVEAAKMRGKKNLILTGQLGDVMKESAQAALSYIRSQAVNLRLPEDFFENYDIHIHVPAGAIPKDGPSAGVTMAVAVASLFMNRTVNPYLAMTGEVTLRGNILPVGGIKEKVLAAKRAGIKTVLLPGKNQKDLEDIPKALRDELKIIFINSVEEAIQSAIEAPEREPVFAGGF